MTLRDFMERVGAKYGASRQEVELTFRDQTFKLGDGQDNKLMIYKDLGL